MTDRIDAPAAADTEFAQILPALVPPAPPPVVAPEQANAMVKLSGDETTKLDAQVADFVSHMLSLDINAPDFTSRVNAISTMGNAEVAQSAQLSNRMLDRPLAAMKNGVYDASSPISHSLLDLRNTVESLDPSKQGDLFAPRKLLGMIPMGSRLLEYFDRYRSSQSHLNAILNALYHGKDELLQDNAAIETEKVRLWNLMQRIEQYIYLGKKLDAEISAKIATVEASDPAKAKILKEEVLFYTRQKVQDLLTQMAVNVQGYLALDLIRKNNLELVKGVDRATTTTVSALRTAIMVAQALANEKLVLDQISALNATTSSVIEGTSQMLRTQTAQVYQQAAASTVNMDSLKRSFDNVFATMDAISDYKTKALDTMQQNVDALQTQVDRAKTYLDRTRQETVTATLADTHLDALGTDASPSTVSILPKA
jgi:uncharacterized protein YaaN involved in tellurite resistance